jgi:hypothetical protein
MAERLWPTVRGSQMAFHPSRTLGAILSGYERDKAFRFLRKREWRHILRPRTRIPMKNSLTRTAKAGARRESPKVSVRDSLRNALAFLAGPALIVLLIAAYLGYHPPAWAHPSQAAALQLGALLPVLGLGTIGVFLSVHSGMTPDPLRQGWRKPVIASVVAGLVLGGAAFGLDFVSGFSALIAQKLGIHSIHIAFPASLYVYTAGGIVVECLYRLIPLGIGFYIVATLILRGRFDRPVYWGLASLTSFIEPLSQAPLVGFGSPLVAVLFGFIFVFNLSEAELLRKYGWIAPILARLVFYSVWHVGLGPLLTS